MRTKPMLAVIAATVLAGCAMQEKEPPVNVVGDSFCTASKKRSWSVNDTPESIQEAIRINRGIDRACGKGKAVS